MQMSTYRNQYVEISLHLASCEGELEVTRVLLRHGAPVYCRSRDGWTPLMAASQYGYVNVVQSLLENGAAVDSRNDADWTPLTLASRSGHRDIEQLFLGAGGTPSDPGPVNEKLGCPGATDGGTCTRTVSQSANPNLVSSHDRGQKSSAPGSNGKKTTSLHTAAEEGDLGAVRLLLLHHDAEVNERNESHQTPLDVAKLLIDRGTDVNSRDKSGWTPLHKASRFGQLDVVRLLLDRGADVDAQKQDHWTPLHLAVGNHYREVVQVLLEQQAKVDILNDERQTPHGVALRRGAADIADLLSKYMGRHGGE